MITTRPVHLVLYILTCLSLVACDSEEQDLSTGNQQDAGEMGGGAATDGGGGGDGAGALAGEERGGQSGGATGGAGGAGRVGCSASDFQSRDLLPEQRSTQIHPDAAWDGEAFWITWTIPNDEGKFEVWAGRFGCDLNPIVEPFPLVQEAGMNDTDSALAVSGGRVLIAWIRDNGFANGAQYNLSTLTQVLQAQTGERVGAVQSLSLTTEGLAREGNLWMPDVSPSPEGGFVVAASWGNPEANSFQVVMLPVAETGEVSEGWVVEPEGRDQINPYLSQYGSTFDVMWSGKSSSEEGASEGFWVKSWRLTEGTWSSDPLIDLSDLGWISAAVGRGLTQTYEQAIQPSETEQEGAPYLIGAQQGGALELVTPDGVRGSAGANGVTNLGPMMSYGLISAYQRISGSQNKVWWRTVDEQGALQPEVLFRQDGPAAPYPLSITPFPGGYLALWAQGYNPEFMLKATLFGAE